MISQTELSTTVVRAIQELRNKPLSTAAIVTDRVLRLLPAAAEERERVEWLADYALWREWGQHFDPPPVAPRNLPNKSTI